MSYSIPNLQGSPVLIGTHKIITQSMLNSVAPARAADLYGFSGITKERNLTLIVIGKLVLEFAKICNFTPIVVNLNDISSGKINENEYGGTIIPFVVPKVVSKYFSPVTKTKASMSLAVYQYFNFVYCDLDRDLHGTDLKLLLRPFQPYCWLFLMLNVIILPVFLNHKKYLVFLFTVFGALFGQEVFASNIKSRSKLLTLWICACIVISTLYSGFLTSLLIAPAEKDVIKSVEDLANRGYKFVYTEHGFFKYVSYMVEQLEGNVDEKGSPPIQRRSPLKILIESINFKSTLPAMVDALAFEPKTALLGPIGLIMQYWGILSEKNENRNKKTKLRRKCRIGKYLDSAYAHPEVWIFKKGNKVSSMDLLRIFNQFHASGAHTFWMDTFDRIQRSSRAQDTNRFKSATEIKEEVPVEALGFQNGSVSVIFTVGGIMIIVCWWGFIFEVIWHFLGHRNIMQSEVQKY